MTADHAADQENQGQQHDVSQKGELENGKETPPFRVRLELQQQIQVVPRISSQRLTGEPALSCPNSAIGRHPLRPK
jgi:hypothetical protein